MINARLYLISMHDYYAGSPIIMIIQTQIRAHGTVVYKRVCRSPRVKTYFNSKEDMQFKIPVNTYLVIALLLSCMRTVINNCNIMNMATL